jgi:hypothetical protein
MKSKAVLLLTCLLIFFLAKSQTVVVNADGTHSTIIDNGATKTIVNPDGTHTIVINNGVTKTIVNPNGTHSTIIDNGSTKTIINPNGTHTLVVVPAIPNNHSFQWYTFTPYEKRICRDKPDF